MSNNTPAEVARLDALTAEIAAREKLDADNLPAGNAMRKIEKEICERGSCSIPCAKRHISAWIALMRWGTPLRKKRGGSRAGAGRPADEKPSQ